MNPNSWIINTKAGHDIILDDTAGFYVIHKSGSQLQIDEKGSCS